MQWTYLYFTKLYTTHITPYTTYMVDRKKYQWEKVPSGVRYFFLRKKVQSTLHNVNCTVHTTCLFTRLEESSLVLARVLTAQFLQKVVFMKPLF